MLPVPVPRNANDFPYDYARIFHDAENCPVPSRFIVRDVKGHRVMRADGKVSFVDYHSMGLQQVQGDIIYREVLRTALACKVSETVVANTDIMSVFKNVTYNFILNFLNKKNYSNPFHPSQETLTALLTYRVNVHATDTKPGGVDKKMRELISQTLSDSSDLSFSNRKRTLFIVISGDRDFSSEIMAIREQKFDCVLIHSFDCTASPATVNILKSSVWAPCKWLDIVNIATQPLQSFANSASTQINIALDLQQDRKQNVSSSSGLNLQPVSVLPNVKQEVQALSILASPVSPTLDEDLIYGTFRSILELGGGLHQSSGTEVNANVVSKKLYEIIPTSKDRVKAFGGMKKICNNSCDALKWQDKPNNAIGTISCSVYGLLVYFVKSKQNRIPASMLGEFYKKLGNYEQDMKVFFSVGVRKIIEAGDGSLEFEEKKDDKKIGFGYINYVVKHQPMKQGSASPSPELARCLLLNNQGLSLNNAPLESFNATHIPRAMMIPLDPSTAGYAKVFGNTLLNEVVAKVHHTLQFKIVTIDKPISGNMSKKEQYATLDSLAQGFDLVSDHDKHQAIEALTAAIKNIKTVVVEVRGSTADQIGNEKTLKDFAYQERVYSYVKDVTVKSTKQQISTVKNEPKQIATTVEVVQAISREEYKDKARVVLVYIDDHLAGLNRIKAYLLGKERLVKQIPIQECWKVGLCRASWSMLKNIAEAAGATVADFPLRFKRDLFIQVKGSPQDIENIIRGLSMAISTAQKKKIPIPDKVCRCDGLYQGLSKTALDLLNCDNDNRSVFGDTSGSTSCVDISIELKNGKLEVYVSCLPISAENDNSSVVSRWIEAIGAVEDIIDKYDELKCNKNDIRAGIRHDDVLSKFPLFDYVFRNDSHFVLLCGLKSVVEEAYSWLTRVPTAEVVQTRPFCLPDKRHLWLLRMPTHVATKNRIYQAIASEPDISKVTYIAPAISAQYPKALYLIHGISNVVDRAYKRGLTVLDDWITTLNDESLANHLSANETQYLRNEGLQKMKQLVKEHGVVLVDAAAAAGAGKSSSISYLAHAQMGNVELKVTNANILDVACGALINPANKNLRHGAGAALAIANAAGPEIITECEAILLSLPGGIVAEGSAVATSAYQITKINKYAKTVIHAVGPEYFNGSASECSKYRQTIRSAITLAVSEGATYVNLPLMGVGVFKWPVGLAAQNTVLAVSEWVGSGGVCKVITLVDFNSEHAAALNRALRDFAVNGPSPVDSTVAPTTTTVRPPKYEWYWEHHEIGDWVAYDYDQVFQIEEAMDSGSFPITVRGDVGGTFSDSKHVPPGERSAVYEIRMEKCNSRLVSATTYDFCQMNLKSKFKRPIRFNNFIPGSSIMHGYTDRVQVATVPPPVDAIRYELVDRFLDTKSDGFSLYGTAASISTAKVAINDVLQNAVNSSGKPFDLSFTDPEPWEETKKRLMDKIEAGNLHVELIDEPGTTTTSSTRHIRVRVLGVNVLYKAEREIMEFIADELRTRESTIEWPLEWTGGPFNHSSESVATLEEVDPASSEWMRVEDEWRERANNGPSLKFLNKLLRIQRVQNTSAWAAYYSRVKLLASRDNTAGNTLFSRANERWMKHGTRSTNPDVIWKGEQGLDFRHSAVGGLFGVAAYTGEDAEYCHRYRFSLNNKTKDYCDLYGYPYDKKLAQMFIVRVAAGRIHEIEVRTLEHKKLIKPPANFDSVRGVVLDGLNKKAIMVYQTDSAYPAYLLTYEEDMLVV